MGMGRITNDSDGGKILDLSTHRQLFKTTNAGDLYVVKRGELGQGWTPIEDGSTMRRVIWSKFRGHGVMVPWREANGHAMGVDGFTQVVLSVHERPAADCQFPEFTHPLDRGDWVVTVWMCDYCGASYEDSPREVDHIGRYGCRNGACPEYIRRIEALRQLGEEDLTWGT